MQDQETPKKRTLTRWDQPPLTLIGFSSLDPPEPETIVDVDQLTKCQRLVSDICEASHEMQEGELETEALQQSLVDVNVVLRSMNERMLLLEGEVGAAGELSSLRREGRLYADLFRELNDPLDFTLPWPPTSPEIVQRYQAVLRQAAREVALSVRETETQLRPYLLKKRKTPTEDSPPSETIKTHSIETALKGSPNQSAPHHQQSTHPPTPITNRKAIHRLPNQQSVLEENLRTATGVEDWKELRDVAEQIRSLPLPVYMPSYPEPYKESKLPNLPKPNLPPQIITLIRTHQWIEATQLFLQTADHHFHQNQIPTETNHFIMNHQQTYKETP